MKFDDYMIVREKANQGLRFMHSPLADKVTVVAYFFRSPDEYVIKFRQLRVAIEETWRHCGMLPTVLVVNQVEPCVEAFAAEHSGYVQVKISPILRTGDLHSMSRDCMQNLHTHFETDYVLVVQDDGFPLRSGLDEFVGRYDYIGAPFQPSKSLVDFYTFTYPRGAVGNGGFSLRSHRICEAASNYYTRYYTRFPNIWLMVEDVFYCRTMPFFSRKVRREMVYAPREVAGRFSVEKELRFLPEGELPFGFHSREAFERLDM